MNIVKPAAYFNPKISSAETSIIWHKLANVSIAGNLLQCKYLFIVEGFTPSLIAICFLDNVLVSIASRKFF